MSDEKSELDGAESGPAPIATGENICWSGRRGFGAIGANRLFMAAFCAPAPLIFFGLLWQIWSSAESMGGAGGLLWGGLMTFGLSMLIGAMAWFVSDHAPAFVGDLFVEIFGRLAVSDRRILFIAPLTGAVHRNIPADRIIEALLIEVDERGRGYISLTLKGEEGEKDEIMDLYSVPDPDNALDSIARLIRPQ